MGMKRFTWVQEERVHPLSYRVVAMGPYGSPTPTYNTYKREVEAWVAEHDSGYWVHNYMIRFKSPEDATMFLLRWA